MNSSRVALPAGVCLLVALAIQLFRPARTNPSVNASDTIAAHVNMPSDVQATVRRACFDCHSDETRWPWYSGVAPVSWFVIGHVNDGRRALNFSDWNAHSRRSPAPPLNLLCGEVKNGAMPLSSYLLLHHDARLSSDDVALLCAWSEAAWKQLSGHAGPSH